jgi:hypothetical protein
MLDTKQTSDFFETLAKVLARCTILGFLLLLFWFAAIMLAGDLVYTVHGGMFGLSPSELNVIHYCGMGLTKLVVGCFFLIPWVAIRLVLEKRTD